MTPSNLYHASQLLVGIRNGQSPERHHANLRIISRHTTGYFSEAYPASELVHLREDIDHVRDQGVTAEDVRNRGQMEFLPPNILD